MASAATQYLLPEGLGIDGACARLATSFDLVVGPSARIARTFYDTFDGRLHAAGLVLIAASGRLVAAAGTGYRELAAVGVDAGERLLVQELPAGALRDLLEPIVEVRALTPIARARSVRRELRVLDGETKTVVRLALEAPDPPLRARLHLIGVRGYDRALERARRTLAGELDFEATVLTLHDEAVLAAGAAPGGTPTRLDLRLAPETPAAAGAATALVEMHRTIELTLPGAVADLDIEFLHDLRVAVRRTRSVQRQLAAVFMPERLRHFRQEFRWLGQETGPTRDLDVLLHDFARLQAELPSGRAAELAPLGELLRARRERERRRMSAALGSDRTAVLLGDWKAFLEADGRGGPPLRELVGRRIRTVYRQMRRAGLAIDDQSEAELLHDLRKQGKELRYLLEIFASVFPPDAVRPTVKTLKALQETLGEFQDRWVQAAMLRSFSAELAAAPGGPAALLALGGVLERIEAESVAARLDFAQRFAVFAADAQRAVIREAFR